VNGENILVHLFEVLDSSKFEENYQGYFSKIVSSLVKSQEGHLLEFLSERDILKKFLRHVESNYLMVLLREILTGDGIELEQEEIRNLEDRFKNRLSILRELFRIYCNPKKYLKDKLVSEKKVIEILGDFFI
jgi:hypothetical protein